MSLSGKPRNMTTVRSGIRFGVDYVLAVTAAAAVFGLCSALWYLQDARAENYIYVAAMVAAFSGLVFWLVATVLAAPFVVGVYLIARPTATMSLSHCTIWGLAAGVAAAGVLAIVLPLGFTAPVDLVRPWSYLPTAGMLGQLLPLTVPACLFGALTLRWRRATAANHQPNLPGPNNW